MGLRGSDQGIKHVEEVEHVFDVKELHGWSHILTQHNHLLKVMFQETGCSKNYWQMSQNMQKLLTATRALLSVCKLFIDWTIPSVKLWSLSYFKFCFGAYDTKKKRRKSTPSTFLLLKTSPHMVCMQVAACTSTDVVDYSNSSRVTVK